MIQAKEDWSSYHKLIAEALRIYREEGMIELEDYSAFLSANDRKFIHNYATQLVNKQNEKDLLDYGKHAYQEYTSYQTEKLSYYRSDESIYVDEVHSRNETLSHLKQLEEAISIPSDFNFKEVMARIVAKTLAGMYIMRHGDHFGEAIFYHTRDVGVDQLVGPQIARDSYVSEASQEITLIQSPSNGNTLLYPL